MPTILEVSEKIRSEFLEGFEVAAKIEKPYKPHKVKNASFEKALELDQNGRWKKAADYYFTLLITSTSPKDKAEAFILLSQMYINLANYKQADEFLTKESSDAENSLSGWEKEYFIARVNEKLGWIYDYYGEPKKALDHFSEARRILEKKKDDDDTVLRAYETSNHFAGRQLMILAWKGENTGANIKNAIERFEESLKIYKYFREKGKPDAAAEGFQHAWLARAHMMDGNLTRAEGNLSEMKRLFEEHILLYPEGGLMRYYRLLYGRLFVERGEIPKAKENFGEALRISTLIVNYPPTQADALFGLAICEYLEGNKESAKEKALEAVKVNRHLLDRGYI